MERSLPSPDQVDRAVTIALSIVQANQVRTPEMLEEAASDAAELVGKADRNVEIAPLKAKVRRELEARLDVFHPESVGMVGDQAVEEWLDKEQRGEIHWKFTERYLRYLRETERLPPAVLRRLDNTSMTILSHLGRPDQPGVEIDRRGLVVGQVQSGKTGNYIALACRAADAGFPLVVVLAGRMNNLRSQTQLRFDQGFLGFDTQKRQRLNANDPGDFAAAAIGVGRLRGAERLPVASITTSHERGDFLSRRANEVAMQIGLFPIVLVVKKHRSILDNLRQWILDNSAVDEDGRVKDFPILVIDDEADDASIGTQDPFIDGLYRPDEVDPTAINRSIRQLLYAFERRNYVGYTATPNANIFIPANIDSNDYGPDLFPRDFIEYLRPPTNYFGPDQMFGGENIGSAPLARVVSDYSGWIPDRHPNGHVPGPLPDSLVEALRTFVLACATRLARGHDNKHNTMLIHVSRFQSVQHAVDGQIREALDDLSGRLRFDMAETIPSLRQLWEKSIHGVSVEYPNIDPELLVNWEQVGQRLIEAVDGIQVRLLNGSSEDALEYFEHSDEGLSVIAVGGNKLSRGLTLEGLTVSYYLRAAGAHDTLMQMGRWFGYKQEYEDLCRIFTTGRLFDAFRGVAEANRELADEFIDMAKLGQTPEDYGLKVRNTVAGMVVTSRNKMRHAVRKRIGYSGQGPSTVVLHAGRERATVNQTIVNNFVSSLEESSNGIRLDNDNVLWRDVNGTDVAELFFQRYQSPLAAWRVQGDAIAEYITNRIADSELTRWTVLLGSSSDPEAQREAIGGLDIGLFKRAPYKGTESRLAEDGHYSIRQVVSPRDEAVDLDRDQYAAALERTRDEWRREPGRRRTVPEIPSGPEIRRERSVEHGLLVIYPLHRPDVPADADPRVQLTDGPIIGFLASFPHSPGAPAIDYVVNQVYEEMFDPYDDDEAVS